VADNTPFVTAFPSALTVAASWNRTAMYLFGQGMGKEQHDKGTNVHLAPAVNIVRTPMLGRAFEYMGEDAYLTSQLVYQEVQGIQSNNVTACVKHFAVNVQETERNSASSNLDQKTFMELYSPAFASAVAAGVGTAMCSYNRIGGDYGDGSGGGVYACENNRTIAVLRETFGFRGALMSDWGAVHSTIPSINAGLGMEMPLGVYYGLPLELALESGQVPMSALDDIVLRILTPMYALGIFADPPTPSRNLLVNVTSDTHNSLARELAEQGTVLLQNDGGFLPRDPASPALTSVLVCGDTDTIHGSGSGSVIPPYIITPAQGIRNVLGPRVNVTEYDGQDASVAANLAASADLVVISVATSSSEGVDRADLSLPSWQDALVAAVAAVNNNTSAAICSLDMLGILLGKRGIIEAQKRQRVLNPELRALDVRLLERPGAVDAHLL
jgi:beta-glucosidase